MVVQSWVDEESHYNSLGRPAIGDMSEEDSKKVGHYTQIVWASTTNVGCGLATYGITTIVTCSKIIID
jgi:hypothetical protein